MALIGTAVNFPDPRRAVRDLLREALADRPEPFAQGVTISVGAPGDSRPHIQVASDGRFRNARLDGRATVRVLVWHVGDGEGEALAALAESLLLASGSRDVRGVRPITGPLPTRDPDTDEPLSYFTATVRLRPFAV